MTTSTVRLTVVSLEPLQVPDDVLDRASTAYRVSDPPVTTHVVDLRV